MYDTDTPVREFLDEYTTILAAAFANEWDQPLDQRVAEHVEDYCYTTIEDFHFDIDPDDAKDELTNHPSVNWAARKHGSRLVLGLGRTFNGHYIRDDRTPVVAKIDAATLVGTRVYSGNPREIAVWDIAQQVDAGQYFATTYDWGLYGAWTIQEECLPLYYRERPPVQADGLTIDDRTPLRAVRQAVEDAGFTGAHDTKHGNVGFRNPETRDGLVYVDYGSHFGHENHDVEQRVDDLLFEPDSHPPRTARF